MSIFEINKSNLIYNLKYIRERLNNKVKLCAMVKGDAYGHNANIIAPLIQNYVDYFGVATIKEGLKLRTYSKIYKPILCVGKIDNSNFKLASLNNIEITVESLDQIKYLIENKYNIKIHLKIDTGMHRLGFFNLNDFKIALKLIKKSKNIKLIGVFTHFCKSDELNYIEQRKVFSRYLELCPKNIIIHCANSLASRYNTLQYSMVRIGLSMYGYGELRLKKVLKIKSKVISIRCVKNNNFIGYDNGYLTVKDSYIATIFLGYYDGINRKLSNKGLVQINGRYYKIVGNICMDMFMALVDENVKVGDEVVVFDNADYWAKIVGTIPYEILTSFKYERLDYKIIT